MYKAVSFPRFLTETQTDGQDKLTVNATFCDDEGNYRRQSYVEQCTSFNIRTK